jgi:ankyrin repeat protein
MNHPFKVRELSVVTLLCLMMCYASGCSTSERSSRASATSKSDLTDKSDLAQRDDETERRDASKEASSKATETSIGEEDFRLAAYEGKIETVRQAIESGIDVNGIDRQQRLTALHMAAYNGHSRVVRLLIENGAKIDALDHEGKTALTHACTGPFQETVSALVDAGADIDLQESTEGFTPLMMAAGLGQTEVVKVLLRNKANTSVRDYDGDRAIDHARNSRHLDIVDLLTE